MATPDAHALAAAQIDRYLMERSLRETEAGGAPRAAFRGRRAPPDLRTGLKARAKKGKPPEGGCRAGFNRLSLLSTGL